MDETRPKLELMSFTNDIVTELQAENEKNASDAIVASFTPILDIIFKEAAQSNLVFFRQYWFTILNLFSAIEPLAKLVIKHSTPKSNQGRAYADTLLGSLLSLSCLPKTIGEPFYFFDKPLQQVGNMYMNIKKKLNYQLISGIVQSMISVLFIIVFNYHRG